MLRPAHTTLCRSSSTALTLALLLAGCKTAPAPPSDTAMASQISSQITADQALAGTQITTQVTNGVAILGGTVLNDAQRTLAARDAASVTGVKQVNINFLQVGAPPSTSAMAAPPAALPGAFSAPSQPSLVPQPRRPAPVQRGPQPVQGYQPQPVQSQPVQTVAPPPPPPPRPAFRNVTMPAGTALPVRVTQTLDSASTQAGDSFSGVLSSDVVVDGLVAVPAGSAVSGHVDAVQEAAHFKGNSLLTVSLVDLRDRGERIAVSADPYSVTGKGRGKNTAEKAGGGAAVGAILGGIFGGGKGAAIGAAAGGGTGAGVNAVTRGQQVQIQSESVVRFSLNAPITVRVRTDAGNAPAGETPGLQPR